MIKHFRDLIAWREAHALVLMIYKIARKFPDFEKFGLTSQITRSAISITSNIAEGFSRNTNKDKLQFYAISKGSLSEMESQLLIAKDLGYINDSEISIIEDKIILVSKLLAGLSKSAMSR